MQKKLAGQTVLKAGREPSIALYCWCFFRLNKRCQIHSPKQMCSSASDNEPFPQHFINMFESASHRSALKGQWYSERSPCFLSLVIASLAISACYQPSKQLASSLASVADLKRLSKTKQLKNKLNLTYQQVYLELLVQVPSTSTCWLAETMCQ